MQNGITDMVDTMRFYDDIDSTLTLTCFDTPESSDLQNVRLKFTTNSGEFYMGYSDDYKKHLTMYGMEGFGPREEELTKFEMLIEDVGDIPWTRILVPGGNFYLSARGSIRVVPMTRKDTSAEWLAIPPIPKCAFSSWTEWGECRFEMRDYNFIIFSATCGQSSRSRERVPVGDFASWKLTNTFYKIHTSEPCETALCPVEAVDYYPLY